MFDKQRDKARPKREPKPAPRPEEEDREAALLTDEELRQISGGISLTSVCPREGDHPNN
jgi:bacteriocin-like protein